MINSVQLKNFKGHNRAFQLGAATMIVGDNFKGKSGLFQAIALGIHGWLKHPTGDKKLDPWGLSSGNPMEVNMDFAPGTMPNDLVNIRRQWEQDRRGSVRYSGYDGEPLMPPIMMDARTYFDLSADKRMRYVFGAVKLGDGEFSAAKLVADMKNLKVDPMTEAHQAALNEVVTFVSNSWDGFSAEREMGAPITIQDWLSKLIEDLKERAKLAKQAVDRMVKTVTGITELQLRSTEDIDANTAALENQLQSIREQIAAKQSEFGALSNRIKVATEKRKHFEGLIQELAKLPAPDEAVLASEEKVNDTAERLSNEANALSRELGSLEAQLRQLDTSRIQQIQISQTLNAIDEQLAKSPDQSATLAELEESSSKLREESKTLEKQLADDRSERERLITQWSKSAATINALTDELRAWKDKLASLDTTTSCPYCACAGENFKATAKLHFESEIARVETLLEAEKPAKEKNESDREVVRTRVANAEKRTGEIALQLRANDTAARNALTTQNQRTNALTRREEVLKQVAPTSDGTSLNAQLAAVRAKITANNNAMIENEKVLVTITMMRRANVITTELANAPENEGDLNMLSATTFQEKERLESEYTRIDADVKKGVSAKTDALRQNQAIEERDRAKAEQDMTKLAVESVSEFQQKMVDTSFGTIIRDANRFTSGILDSPLEYAEGEIGRGSMRNGKMTFVTHEYLSGTEQALCFAGISVALAMQSPFRLVMIDEMTRLSDRNKDIVLHRMCKLIDDGVIHQFIGVDTSAKPYRLVTERGAAVQFIEL